MLLQKGENINQIDKLTNKPLCEAHAKGPVAQFFVKNSNELGREMISCKNKIGVVKFEY